MPMPILWRIVMPPSFPMILRMNGTTIPHWWVSIWLSSSRRNVGCRWDLEIAFSKVSVGLNGLEDCKSMLLDDSNIVYDGCSPYGNHSQQAFHFFHLLHCAKFPWICSWSIWVNLVLGGHSFRFVKEYAKVINLIDRLILKPNWSKWPSNAKFLKLVTWIGLCKEAWIW